MDAEMPGCFVFFGKQLRGPPPEGALHSNGGRQMLFLH
jgi:hypothetical protein